MSLPVVSDPSGEEIVVSRRFWTSSPAWAASPAVFAALLIAIPAVSRAFDEAPEPEPTVIVSPDVECRILMPLEDVIGHASSEDDEEGLFMEPAGMLDDAWLTLHLEEGIALRTLEVEAFLVVTPWDADSVTWEYPWEIPGGDLFLSLKRDKKERHLAAIEELRAGERREKLEFDVRRAMETAWEEGYVVHGFALSVPWEEGAGFSPGDLEILGPVSNASLDLVLRAPPSLGGIILPPLPPPPPPDVAVMPPPSQVKEKPGRVPGKPTKAPVKAPAPPPPPPADQPDGERPVEDRRPGPVEKVVDDPPAPRGVPAG
jgi:hypothetical protein